MSMVIFSTYHSLHDRNMVFLSELRLFYQAPFLRLSLEEKRLYPRTLAKSSVRIKKKFFDAFVQ